MSDTASPSVTSVLQKIPRGIHPLLSSPLQQPKVCKRCIDMRHAAQQGKALALAFIIAALIGSQGNHTSSSTIKSEDSDEWSQVWLLLALAVLLGGIFLLRNKKRLFRSWKVVSLSTSSALSSVSSSKAMLRIRSSVNASSMKLMSMASKCGSRLHFHTSGHCGEQERMIALTGKMPILRNQITESLSLSDIKDVFRSVLRGKTSVLTKTTSPLWNAIQSMEIAVELSRGTSTMEPYDINIKTRSAADIDALDFVAACRIFADWRATRLVPQGHPRYAVVMNLAQRDLVQNITKIETCVHKYLDTGNNDGVVQSRSPTIQQLIQFEIDHNIHRKLPRLVEPSAANGLLWTVRQLRYQTRIFANVSAIPLRFPDSKSANYAAYEATYANYHGFLTRHIFLASLDVAPDTGLILQHMMQSSAVDDQSKITGALSSDDEEEDSDDFDDNASWMHLDLDPFEGTEVEAAVSLVQAGKDEIERANMNLLERIGSHLTREWFKLERFFQQCKGQPTTLPPHGSTGILKSPPVLNRTKVVDDEIASFVEFMTPLLNDLDTLIERSNMNDPTRV